MPLKVIKNAKIATAIQLEIVPLTIQQSMDIVPPSVRNGIPIDSSYSPPFAGNAKLLTTNKFLYNTINFFLKMGQTSITLLFPSPLTLMRIRVS